MPHALPYQVEDTARVRLHPAVVRPHDTEDGVEVLARCELDRVHVACEVSEPDVAWPEAWPGRFIRCEYLMDHVPHA